MKKRFSVVIPIYNNEKNLPITIPYMIEHLSLFDNYDVEIIMVNDGSPDESYEVMKTFQKKYPHLIKIGSLTRNYGQLECIHAGMKMATGDVVGVISADMQDPFELFADMLAEWKKGYKIVSAVRESRDEKGLYVLCSKVFHKFTKKFLNKSYPTGGCDFYIMDKQAVDDYLMIDKPLTGGLLNRYWIGYSHQTIPYTRQAREVGKSGFSIKKKVDVAIGVIFMNSVTPVKMLFYLSLFCVIIGVVFFVLSIISNKFVLFICALISVLAGIIQFGNYVLGEYIWRNYEVSKNRPRYLVEEVIDETQNVR